LVNRNYTQILGLTGGTNTDVVDATLLGAGSQELRANGARSSDNNFMLNGVDANSYGGNMTEGTNNSGGGLCAAHGARGADSDYRGAEPCPTAGSRRLQAGCCGPGSTPAI